MPTQKRVTQQLSTHWAPFKALRQRYAGSRFEQQLQLHLPQKHKATEQDSALRVEMTGLEDQADNAKPRELLWKPLSWLGTLRPTTANDAWDPALWQTFFSSTIGLEVPALSSLPRHNHQPTANVRLQEIFIRLARRPCQHLPSSLRCHQSARLDGIRSWTALPYCWA